MKRFSMYVAENDVQERLEERFVRGYTRSGVVIAHATASKRHGDAAVKHLNSVSTMLNAPVPPSSNQIELRLERVERSLEAISLALKAMRSQIGSAVLVATSGALLADKISTKLVKR